MAHPPEAKQVQEASELQARAERPPAAQAAHLPAEPTQAELAAQVEQAPAA